MKTTTAILRCTYQVDAVPKGARKPRRLNLCTAVTAEIETVAPAALARGVVKVRPANDPVGISAAPDCFTLDGYDGRLWSPMHGGTRRHQIPHLGPGDALRIEDYLACHVRPWPGDDLVHDDPVTLAYDPKAAAWADNRGLAHIYPTDLCASPEPDADFSGEILWDNKADAVRRHLRAAETVLVVGDVVHRRRAEPVFAAHTDRWLSRNSPRVELFSRNSDLHSALTFDFRLDRRDTAFEWLRGLAQKTPGAPTAAGTLVSYAPDWLTRDDLAINLAARLGHLARHAASPVLVAALPDAGVEAWLKLRRFAEDAAAATFRDAAGAPSDETVRALHDLKENALSRAVPTGLDEHRATAVETIDGLLRYHAFEMLRRPRMDADESALTAMRA